MQTQFDGRYPQHGRAFLTTGFVAAAFEGGRRGLLCSRAFLYSLCFILLYRRSTCFGFILRNLSFWFPVEFFGAWLSRFLFVCCSVAGGIKVNSRNFYERLSASALCSKALVFPHVTRRRGRQAEMPQSFLSHKQCKRWIKLECLTYLVQPRSRRNNNKTKSNPGI